MKPECIRRLVGMLVEAASEHGEAMEVVAAARRGAAAVTLDAAACVEQVTRARKRTMRDALLVALDAEDPTEQVPF